MDKLKNYFKNKKILVISTTCTHIHDHYLKNTHPFFQKIFGKIILFDTRINFYKYGKGDLNKKIMKIVKDEKPDYILFEFGYDEISLKTFDKIREILPETKILAHLGDDNWKFDDFSRYYSLFLDYVLVSEKDDSYYKKDGIKNTFFIGGANLNMFKPLNIKKKYDVTFIGNPIRDRPDFLRFLIKNNINVKIFSELWSSYPDLKDAWGGFLDEKKITEIINSSKINLNFSKTFIKCKKNTQMKGRIFEVLACKSFLLTEHFDGIELYLDGADKISFKTKKELLEKINYFLKNEEAKGKRIWIYGASTRGNIVLQYFGLDSTIISGIADKNSDKWGKKTVGSLIPIFSPEKMREANPDYLLVNTWHFLNEIVNQEKDYFDKGGKFIVALPEFKVISKD